MWIEGEKASRRTTFPNAWFDAVDPSELSGNAQVGSFSEPNQPAGSVEFDVSVPAAARYHFWLRANPGTGLLYAANGSRWIKLDTDLIAREDKARERTQGLSLTCAAANQRRRRRDARRPTDDVV